MSMDPDFVAGTAIAAFRLQYSTLMALTKAGMLPSYKVVELIDGVLLTIEQTIADASLDQKPALYVAKSHIEHVLQLVREYDQQQPRASD